MKKTVEKWFDILGLPTEWRKEILENADRISLEEIEKNELPFQWLLEQENKLVGLIYTLYKCEDFFNTGRKRDIPENILIKTLSEVKRYAIEHYNTTGNLGISVMNWMGKILNGKIYRLGRLEFEMRDAMHSCDELGLTKGENVIGVHIPDNGGPFTPETCAEAYALAEEFFAKYFPEFTYKHYVCNSWLLDETLRKFLKPESNIIKFMDTFKIAATKEAYSALIYLFGRGVEVEHLSTVTPETSLQKAVVDHLQNGGKLYTTFGVKLR
ncbi:MAG: DUF5596 domain-containing protein [Clostridia bacterium]|nr:DUF5596 domain-containing protein [Clostridia bacterium]